MKKYEINNVIFNDYDDGLLEWYNTKTNMRDSGQYTSWCEKMTDIITIAIYGNLNKTIPIYEFICNDRFVIILNDLRTDGNWYRIIFDVSTEKMIPQFIDDDDGVVYDFELNNKWYDVQKTVQIILNDCTENNT